MGLAMTILGLRKSAMTPRLWLSLIPELVAGFGIARGMVRERAGEFKPIDSTRQRRERGRRGRVPDLVGATPLTFNMALARSRMAVSGTFVRSNYAKRPFISSMQTLQVRRSQKTSRCRCG